MNIVTETQRAVRIFLKDGRSIYGVLLHNLDNLTTTIEKWLFLPNAKVKRYEETHDMSLIEELPNELIEAIDPNLK